MIKLLTLLMLLVEGSERDSTGCDGTGIPACLQEYFQHVKDSVREPDLNDVFMVVSPVEKGDVERYDAVYDAIDRVSSRNKGILFHA